MPTILNIHNNNGHLIEKIETLIKMRLNPKLSSFTKYSIKFRIIYKFMRINHFPESL